MFKKEKVINNPLKKLNLNFQVIKKWISAWARRSSTSVHRNDIDTEPTQGLPAPRKLPREALYRHTIAAESLDR
jgi:hypothetical protein